MDIDIELLPKQQQILQDPHRFKVLDCGRRFGKTEYCAIEHVIKALAGKPNSVQWMIAPTYSTSKIMWRKLKEIIRKCNLSDYVEDIKEGELYIRFINGTTIWCKSADNPENLVGEGLSHVSLDEFGIMKPDVWHFVTDFFGDKEIGAIFPYVSFISATIWAYLMSPEPIFLQRSWIWNRSNFAR